jgi:hypothetical protein
MLGETDGGIRPQGKAGNAESVEVFRAQAGVGQQRVQRTADPPMRAVDGEALVGNGDGNGGDHAVIRRATAHAVRCFIARVSMQVGFARAWDARSFITPRWILLVDVSGRVSTKTT